MKERPILFGAPMVRAILDGTKTVTRRPVTADHAADCDVWAFDEERGLWEGGVYGEGGPIAHGLWMRCPYGVAGDRLYVRETWGCREADHPRVPGGRKPQRGDRIVYAADEDAAWQWRDGSLPWRPSIHMPRWASRLTLDVVSVRVERVQEMDEGEAVAEGFMFLGVGDDWQRPDAFRPAWDAMHAKRGFGWEANPWVWRVEFRRLT